ncbi:MAG: ankyrin repeat domain-containing protein [Candidatus Babeliales bacterium]|nr:ankyrin repeat domain-containing protein [Candidatus Babeliales bacterium]
MNYRLLLATFSFMAMGLQLQAAQMSDADLAKLTRVAPPGGLVVLSEAEEKEMAATIKLSDALELRYVEDMINSVKQALKEGANVHIHSKMYGDNLLMRAAKKNFTPKASEVIDILIKAGSDVNARNKYNNETPLMIAAGRGNKNVVKQLLNAGADVTLGEEGYKALDKAKDAASHYLEQAKGYAKAAKEYESIQPNEKGHCEVLITDKMTRHFRKHETSKKDFKQESQEYYLGYFDALKIIKMLEKRAN